MTKPRGRGRTGARRSARAGYLFAVGSAARRLAVGEVLAVARAVDVEADGGHGEPVEDGGGDGGVAEVLAPLAPHELAEQAEAPAAHAAVVEQGAGVLIAGGDADSDVSAELDRRGRAGDLVIADRRVDAEPEHDRAVGDGRGA